MIDVNRPDYTNTPASAARARFGYSPPPQEQPCVSIVTPFFNARDEFHETASSVGLQSMQQWEWLIVNDGSDDPTSLAVLAQYRAADARIRVLDLPTRSGPGAARNAGNRVAGTEYVLQLDSDNLIEPTAIEKWWWHLHTEPACAFVNSWAVGFGARHKVSTGGFEQGSRFLSRNWVDGTALVRRSVFESVGGYDEQIRDGLEDWEFWLRCANAGYWGSTLAEPLIWYRWRPGHFERWADWDEGPRQERLRTQLRERYAGLRHTFPDVGATAWSPAAGLEENWPGGNKLTHEKQRLLLIVPWFAVGGADQFNVSLIRQLNQHGWEVSVVSTEAHVDPWISRFTALTPDVFALPRFLGPQDYPRFLAYLIQSRSIDTVMVSHSEFGYDVLPYLRQRCPHVSFVDFVHNVEPTWRNGGYPAFSLERAQFLDVTAVASESIQAWMVDRGSDPERLEVCYINIDAAAASPNAAARLQIRSEGDVTDSTTVILFAGRICDQKQPLVLVETLNHLERLELSFRIWIVGDGPQMPLLRSALKRSRLGSRARLFGELPHEEVLRLMAAADIFFLPSKYEGIALSLYEAMSSGLPVVSVDVGGQRELVTQQCGVLVPHSTPRADALAYAAVLADLVRSQERRIVMGLAARKRIQQEFTIDRMGLRMLEVFERAIGLRRSVRSADGDLSEAVRQALVAVEKAIAQDEERRLAAHLQRTWSVILHSTLSRWFSGLHDLAVRKGWTWIPRAGLYARRLLLGREAGRD